jgi:membrane-associated phospholipid phosphatase
LLMLFSTMPFGGHYFVDLIGGTAVWAIWFAASQRIERGWTPLAVLARFRAHPSEPSPLAW